MNEVLIIRFFQRVLKFRVSSCNFWENVHVDTLSFHRTLQIVDFNSQLKWDYFCPSFYGQFKKVSSEFSLLIKRHLPLWPNYQHVYLLELGYICIVRWSYDYDGRYQPYIFV